MARPPARELTDRELQVMQVFWRHGEATASEARDRLAAAGLDLAYVTVANLIRIVLEKGFLEQTNDERPYQLPRRPLVRRSLAEPGGRPGPPRFSRIARAIAAQRPQAASTDRQGAGPAA